MIILTYIMSFFIIAYVNVLTYSILNINKFDFLFK